MKDTSPMYKALGARYYIPRLLLAAAFALVFLTGAHNVDESPPARTETYSLNQISPATSSDYQPNLQHWKTYTNYQYGFRVLYPPDISPTTNRNYRQNLQTAPVVRLDALTISVVDPASVSGNTPKRADALRLPLQEHKDLVIDLNQNRAILNLAGDKIDDLRKLPSSEYPVYYGRFPDGITLPSEERPLSPYFYAVTQAPSGETVEFIFRDDGVRFLGEIIQMIQTFDFLK